METFNIDNIKANYTYVNELMETCDLLCVQEHWLYSFEKSLMSELIPDVKLVIKCFDENDPIPPSHRPGR